MNMKQRIVLILGSIGFLHSSMVPPVAQVVAQTCRYHEFLERSWFFTRGYGVDRGDAVALASEYGVLAALTAIAFLIAGASKKREA